MATAVVEQPTAPGAASPAAPAAATPAPAGASAAAGAPAAPAATTPAPAAGAPAQAGQQSAASAPKLLLGDVDDKPAAAADSAKAEAAKTDAPAWELKAAEGVKPEDVKAIEAFAKENGLSEQQAQKLLERDLSSRTAAEAAQKAQVDQVAELWMKQAQEHPEIGGAKLEGAVANAKRALLAFATPDERKLIAGSAFANNPTFLAILNRAAAALPAEDTVHPGATAASASPLDPAKVLYGHLSR